MQFRKPLFFIAFTFAFFSAFDTRPSFEATSDCHPCIRDAYFSTLLQTEKSGLCDICDIGAVNCDYIRFTIAKIVFSGRYPKTPIFGAKPVIPSLIVPWSFGWELEKYPQMIIKGPPNPLVTGLLVRWERDMKGFWTLYRLAKWQEWRQKEIDAADDRVRAMDPLHELTAYKGAVAGFYYTPHFAPEKAGTYYYRAMAKLTLGDTELTLRNVEEAQHLYRSAIEDYTHAISRNPQNTYAYVFRSYAKFRLGLLVAAAAGVRSEQAQRH